MNLLRSVLMRVAMPVTLVAFPAVPALAEEPAAAAVPGSEQSIELGRRMYNEGILPSGKTMTAVVQGDIPLTGKQVVCAYCHRRSGMGSMEGQEVAPSVTGDILYNPLRLETSKPPLAPLMREAYKDETLKRAIRDGVNVAGKPFTSLMPRYALSDAELDNLLDYLKTLSTDPDPGVTKRDIHFATVVSDSADPAARKALLDLMQAFVAQKNIETRNESGRAEHAPWHKERIFGPYRKWVLHVWELQGPRETWPQQLAAQYEAEPVFAVLSGVVSGSWQPVHEFCERFEVPCVFPTTDLPVIDEEDFYTVYLSKGMVLEGETVARHLIADGLLERPVIQVYRAEDVRAAAGADALRESLEAEQRAVEDVVLPASGSLSEELWTALWQRSAGAVVVLWLDESELEAFGTHPEKGPGPERLYLSTTLLRSEPQDVPDWVAERAYFVYPQELPDKVDRLLLRSTGWLRMKRIYAPEQKRVQGNAYLALKMTGGALIRMHGYFKRDFFLETFEHMVDNAPYTSVYPRISLAPGQRFIAKGCYIAQLSKDGKGRLEPVTEWTAR